MCTGTTKWLPPKDKRLKLFVSFWIKVKAQYPEVGEIALRALQSFFSMFFASIVFQSEE